MIIKRELECFDKSRNSTSPPYDVKRPISHCIPITCLCRSVSGYYFVDLNKRREASYCNSDEEMCCIVVPAANTASVSSKRIQDLL